MENNVEKLVEERRIVNNLTNYCETLKKLNQELELKLLTHQRNETNECEGENNKQYKRKEDEVEEIEQEEKQGGESRAQRISYDVEEDRQECKWNARGWRCKFGNRCWYKHTNEREEGNQNNIRRTVRNQGSTGIRELCWAFESNQTCRYDTKCRYRHYYTRFEEKLYEEGRYIPSYERNSGRRVSEYSKDYKEREPRRRERGHEDRRGQMQYQHTNRNEEPQTNKYEELNNKVDFLIQKFMETRMHQPEMPSHNMPVQGQQVIWGCYPQQQNQMTRVDPHHYWTEGANPQQTSE